MTLLEVQEEYQVSDYKDSNQANSEKSVQEKTTRLRQKPSKSVAKKDIISELFNLPKNGSRTHQKKRDLKADRKL